MFSFSMLFNVFSTLSRVFFMQHNVPCHFPNVVSIVFQCFPDINNFGCIFNIAHVPHVTSMSLGIPIIIGRIMSSLGAWYVIG